jgi:hypothetical protein
MQKRESGIFSINVLDVNNILPFSKQEGEDFKQNAQAMERVLTQFSSFKSVFERHLGQKLLQFDEETGKGSHTIRFFFDNHEGMMEVLIERPTVVNLYFVRRRDAVKCLHALQQTLRIVIPQVPVRDLFIGSLHVIKGLEEKVTGAKHNLLREIYLHHAARFVGLSAAIFVIISFVETTLGDVIIRLIEAHIISGYIVTLVISAVAALTFLPLYRLIERLVEKLF